jgi:cellulose synthase/poly-beta-1,6-N-acetylglucosamine synthase-like glycosyltransferase
MGFDYDYYKKRMFGVEEMGGEDREMELRVLIDRNVIEYVEEALVYDEKVQDVEVFAKQRTRWLAGQFFFLRKHGKEGIKQLFSGNIDYFNKVLQTMIPPRVIMFGAIPLFAILSYFLDLTPNYKYWMVLLLVMVVAMLMAIPSKLYDKKLVLGLMQIPKAVVFMILGVLNIRTAHDTNFHTPHNTADKDS